MSDLSDRELLRRISADPGGYDGQVAREELEFRKHNVVLEHNEELRRHNRFLLWLTLILALSSLGEVGLEACSKLGIF